MVAEAYSSGSIAGNEDVDMAYMVFLIEEDLDINDIHELFEIVFGKTYSYDTTQKMYQNNIEKIGSNNLIRGTGTFIYIMRDNGFPIDEYLSELKEVKRNHINTKEDIGLKYEPIFPTNYTIEDGHFIEYKEKSVKRLPVNLDNVSNIEEIKDENGNIIEYVLTSKKKHYKAFFIDKYIIGTKNNMISFVSVDGKRITTPMSIQNKGTFGLIFGSFLDIMLNSNEKINDLQVFCDKYFDLNKNRIPQIKGMPTIGWCDCKYYLPTREDNSIHWICDDLILKSITRKGERNEQFDMLKRVMKTPVGLVILAGLSSTILDIVNVKNFVVNVTGNENIGKSVSCMFTTSLVGNPEDIMGTWNGTKVGIETRMVQFKDTPCWIDETQTGDMEKTIEYIFQYHQGHQRERGTIKPGDEIGLRETKYFRGVLITTSEYTLEKIVSLVKKSIPKGIFRRVIEISMDNKSYTSFDESFDIKPAELARFSTSCYGWLLPEWVEFLEKKLDLVKSTYNEIYNDLMETSGIEGLEPSVGVIKTTLMLLSAFLNDEVILSQMMKHIDNVFVVEQQERMTKVRDIISEVSKAIMTFVINNGSYFVGMESNGEGENKIADTFFSQQDGLKLNLYGRVYGNDVFILKKQFNLICEDLGFDSTRVLEKFNSDGLLSTRKNDTKHKYEIQKNLNHKTVWGCYFINVLKYDNNICLDMNIGLDSISNN